MFLRPLNEEQKKLFYNLAVAAASVNHIVEDAEKILLDAYADEMGIDVNGIEYSDMEETCVRLKGISNFKELNQISFEIIGMMVSDGQYDQDEKAFIEKMATIFEIPVERIKEMFKCVKDYSALIKKINKLMFE